eukprot:s3802_g7.t1
MGRDLFVRRSHFEPLTAHLPSLKTRDIVRYQNVRAKPSCEVHRGVCGNLPADLHVCYSLLFGQSFNLAPAKGFSWYHAGLCELLYTFMLTFVVMNVAAAKKNATEKNQYYGMAIAFTVVAGAYGAGAVSGGCFNPAVALGIDVSSAGLGFGWSLAYIVFELLGAGMAAALFKVSHHKNLRQ